MQAWGAPPAAEFTLEVLKGGVLALTVALSGRSHWLLGRHPGCDVALEHPSASRLHCALQFRGDEAYAYDAGSAHGTLLNKRRLKPRVHAPLRVGDQLRFGQSSRVYVLTGPQALLPEEGLSKAERQQLRALEAAAAAADDAAMRAMALVKARAAAGGGDAGVSWGQDASEAADYGEEDAPGHRGGEIDWRTYTGKMNEKQEKAAEKLRKREATMANLASEIERISAKEGSQQGLTAGQSAQVARNEARMEVLRAEMEDAEEALNESLAESSAARAEAAAAGTGAGRAAAARKRRAAAEAEDAAAAGDSDSDEFYDRTAAGGAKRARAAGPSADADKAGPAAVSAPAVDNAETLWAKRAAVQAQLGPAREAAAAAARAAAEEAATSAPAAESGADELDAYMAGVSSELGARAAAAAAADVAALESEEARLTRLLHLADPGGLYTGPRPAPPAPPSEARAAEAPPEARAAAAAAVAAVFGARSTEGGEAAGDAAPEGPDEDGFLAPAALRAQFSQRSALAAMEAALVGGGEAGRGGLLEVRRKPAPGAGVQPARRRAADEPVLSGEELAAAAAASAADDVRRLLARGAGGVDDDAAGDGEDDEAAAAAYAAQRAAWAPPQGQSGDGRTGGNARLGY